MLTLFRRDARNFQGADPFDRRLFKKSPKAPDYTPIAQANAQATQAMKEIAARDHAYRVEQDAFLRPYLTDWLDTGAAASLQQMEIAAKQQGLADVDRARYEETFLPLEREMAREAMQYGRTEDQERKATRAGQAVNEQVDAAAQAANRELTGMGVNPNSGRFAGANLGLRLRGAASAAGAANAARTEAEDKGVALRAGAANFGRGLGNQAAQGYVAAVGSSGAGANSQGASYGGGLSTAQFGAAGSGVAMQPYQAQIQGNLGLGSLMNQSYQIQSQNAASGAAGIGSLLGTGAALAMKWPSSKKIKTDKAPVDGDKVLAALDEVPVEAWTYKPGEGDGGRHVGPYAEDMHRAFGDQVAPGGNKIDVVSALGLNMAALKALKNKVDKIEEVAV